MDRLFTHFKSSYCTWMQKLSRYSIKKVARYCLALVVTISHKFITTVHRLTTCVVVSEWGWTPSLCIVPSHMPCIAYGNKTSTKTWVFQTTIIQALLYLEVIFDSDIVPVKERKWQDQEE